MNPDTQRPQRVATMIETTLLGLLEMDPDDWLDPPLAESAVALIEELGSVADGTRELALILLGFCVVEGRPLNLLDPAAGDVGHNMRLVGDRTASDAVAEVLRSLGIPGTSPLQSSTYRAGYVSPQAKRSGLIASFVRWVSDAARSFEEVSAAFERLAQMVAARANLTRPLPHIDHGRLTFAAVMRLIERLLDHPSGGAHEQYLFAALLGAVLDERADGLRVETGSLHGADKATKKADVEIRQGQNLIEAYEVSANRWDDKLAQAVQLLERRQEVSRVHIVAPGRPSADEIVAGLISSKLPPGVDPLRLDVSVLDLRSELASLVARAGKHTRRTALGILYDFLRLLQPNPELADNLVGLLEELDLTVTLT